MFATKRCMDDGNPPPSKRTRRVSYSGDNGGAESEVRCEQRCEYSAEGCRQLLQCKDTASEALDALLRHQELLMYYTRIDGANFYLSYALAHAIKDSPHRCGKALQVMGRVLQHDPDATRALRAAGAMMLIQQAMHRYPHSLGAYGNALLQAVVAGPTRRVSRDESSMRSDAMAVSSW